VDTYLGNTCTAQDPFDLFTGIGADCVLNGFQFGEETIEATPLIIKFEFDEEDGSFIVAEIGAGYVGLIDGSEFDFEYADDADDPFSAGRWTYTPDAGDPFISAYTAKGGRRFNLFVNDGEAFSGDWFTPANPGGNGPNISNFSFFNNGSVPEEMPVPAPIALVGAGMLALTLVRRRNRRI
jgi:hypothetical protein